MCPSPFLQLRLRSSDLVERWLSLASSEWARACRPESGTCHTPNAHRFPIFGRRLLTAAVSLRPVTRDNPGEMGGRVASPTFVGRVEELQALEAARRRAADGDPAVVLVGGEAGVGKTRLVAELTARCAADGTRVLSGGCVPVGEAAWPTPRSWRPCGTLPPSSAWTPSGSSSVRPGLSLPACCPPWASRTAGPSGQAAQPRLFELLLGLLARLSDQTPLALVVEDLHWADQSTRDLLAFLVRNLRRERVLLVVTYRNDEPGQQRLGPYLAELDRGGPVQRLELARLNRAETAAQLTGILGAAPAVDLVDGVFARSEGNPFFTEELLERVRAGSATLPTTLRDLLQGRIEALPEPAQKVLRVAAVAGRHVPHRLLAAVAGLDEERLDEALRAAVTHQLLINRENGYQFRHALLREVVDAGLLPGERVRLHAAYAHALTQRPELSAGSPAVAAAELAIHWDAAGELDRALPARVQAGLAAEQAHAFPEAERHYERALQLWERVPDPGRPAGLDQVDLLARTADAAAFTGAIKRAIGLLEEALGQVDPAAEPVRAAVLLARLGDRRRVAGDEAGGLAAFEEAERLLAGGPPSAERARVLAAHAYALGVSLRSKEAIPYCEEAIACARAVGARVEEPTLLRILAGGLGMVGQPDRAIALAQEARRIAEAVGDAENVIGTYVTTTFVLGLVGRERDALEEAQQGFQRARELGLERATGSYVAYSLAFSLLNTGRWAECERFTGELLAGDRWEAFHLHNARGTLLARMGEFAAAREQLDLALRLKPTVLARFRLARALRTRRLGGPPWPGGRRTHRGAALLGGAGPRRDPPVRVQPLVLARPAAGGRPRRTGGSQAGGPGGRRGPTAGHPDPCRAGPARCLTDAPGPLPHRHRPPTTRPSRAVPARRTIRPRAVAGGGRSLGAAGASRSRPPMRASGRPRRCSPAARPATKPRPSLRTAHQTTVALGALPLRREIELLAQRGRLRLEEPMDTTASPEAPPSPAASLGLTQREAEVLALVAEGRTNRQIGQALFITPKTAGVHVSRILAKLGVAGRGEAAAVAHRLGLDKL